MTRISILSYPWPSSQPSDICTFMYCHQPISFDWIIEITTVCNFVSNQFFKKPNYRTPAHGTRTVRART